MRNVMKKTEKVILFVIAAAAVVALIGFKVYQGIRSSAEAQNKTIAIYHRDEIVQWFDPNVDAVYTVEGDYGTLDIEVKDGKWRVTNEQCPNHVCAGMGWVGPGEFLPITCLPNNVIVVEMTS